MVESRYHEILSHPEFSLHLRMFDMDYTRMGATMS